MRFTFHNPVEVRFGRGVVGTLAHELVLPALLVGGRQTLARTGLERLVDPRRGVHAHPGVAPNPSPEVVDAGARLAAEVGAKTIVGVGGGSALDAAKSIALLLGNDTGLHALAARAKAGERLLRTVRLVQVPTTAGTGSEVTRWASLWEADGSKWSLDHPAAFADLALVDPVLTQLASARLTAATGLDALAHAMEALWSVHHQPFADAFATRALSRAARHLLPCVTAVREAEVAGSAPPAELAVHRDGLSLAALAAGLAQGATRTAAAHALSYGMTARFGLDHGLAVGLLCRGLLPTNERLVPERVALVRRALGCADVPAVQAWIDAVFHAAGLQPSLAQLGVPAGAHGDLVEQASGADRLANNPGSLGRADLLAVLERIA